MVDVVGILIFVGIFIISSLPLYLAVKLLGGKTSLGLTMIIVFCSGLILAIIQAFFPSWGWLIGFVVLAWVYREAFRLKWWKALIVWFVQALIVFVIGFIALLLGVSIDLFFSPVF